MNHLTDRDIVEIRDGIPVDADLRAHLAGCSDCQAAYATSEARSLRIGLALSALDSPVDVSTAKERVRARLAEKRDAPGAKSTTPSWKRLSWGKAAALLLVAAGSVSALPSSPVRSWLESRTSTGESPGSAAESAVAPDLVGGRLTIGEGPLLVELDEVPIGTHITVLWDAGLAVTVRAAPGTGFSYGEGAVHATIAAGPVLIDLPEGVSAVSITVNGRMYLQGSRDELDVTGPVEERSSQVITFVVDR
jgi:hypothetical protein